MIIEISSYEKKAYSPVIRDLPLDALDGCHSTHAFKVCEDDNNRITAVYGTEATFNDGVFRKNNFLNRFYIYGVTGNTN